MSFTVAPGALPTALAVTAAQSSPPGWPGVMAADRLVVEKEGRDRLAEHPGELAVVSGFTLR